MRYTEQYSKMVIYCFIIKQKINKLEFVFCLRVLQGERPYWWVHEHSNNTELLGLKQFPVSCETGPGKTFAILVQLL